MFKITGVILCVSGCAGYGMLKIAGWNKALLELQQWILLFDKIKSCICYQRDRLEEICIRMNQDIYGIGGVYVYRIGEMALEMRSEGFSEIWNSQMELWKRESALPAGIKELICHFSDYIGEQDYELQISILELFISNLIKEKDILEKQIHEKKKPVMAISLISGMVISILLL